MDAPSESTTFAPSTTESAVRIRNWSENQKMYQDPHHHGDVVLVVGEKRFRAHKNVLGAMSEIFHTAFTNDVSENNKTCDVEITERSPEAVKAMLKHCYGIRLDLHVELDRLESEIVYHSDEDDYATRRMIRNRVMARRTAVQDNIIEKRLSYLLEVYLIADEYRIASLTAYITERIRCLLNTTIHRSLKNQKRFDFLFARTTEFLEDRKLYDWSLLHVTNAFVEGIFNLADYGTMRGPTVAAMYRWRRLVAGLTPLTWREVTEGG